MSQTNETIRCISLWKPWASAWLTPLKRYETRSWPTPHRGLLLVHAAKKQDGEVRAALRDEQLQGDLLHVGITEMACGAIIGCVNLVSCDQIWRLAEPSIVEGRWGDWEDDRFAWGRAHNPTVFRRPIPYKGSQGMFSVPRSVVEEALNGI